MNEDVSDRNKQTFGAFRRSIGPLATPAPNIRNSIDLSLKLKEARLVVRHKV
jgi:hypothetical protein